MTPTEIEKALVAAAQAARQGRPDMARALYRDVLKGGGEHPLALNGLGMDALAGTRFVEASGYFRRAIAVDRSAPELWMNLAKANREAGDMAGEREALEGALSLDQRHFMALVRLAEWHERAGEQAAAAERWRHVLAMAASLPDRPPAIDAMLNHARDYVSRHQAGFADHVERALASDRAELSAGERRRVDACIDHALGRRRIFANDCAGLHFPFLPADEFFERHHFPWLEQIEAQAETIRDELLHVLSEDSGVISPYVAMAPGTPRNKWSDLDHSLAWGAMHLWKDGRRDDAICARVPLTAAAVEALPLSDLPGRTPTVFFSILRPGAHLPAHTGVSNVRSIIHLPLIVPPDCGFRVGGETREWVEGEAWAFDDTIEHEAWNRSDRLRAILIFDVWNPYIAESERALLRRFFAASADVPGAPRLEVSD